MEDKQLEELLRESWQPKLPDGMRERVLNRARRELTRRIFWFPRVAVPRWQVGMAVAGLLIFLASSILSVARENRLASLESSDVPQSRILVAQRPMTMGMGRAQLYRLLDDPTSDLIVP